MRKIKNISTFVKGVIFSGRRQKVPLFVGKGFYVNIGNTYKENHSPLLSKKIFKSTQVKNDVGYATTSKQ